MALGSNIEYKSRALFQAALDEKSAQKLENRFIELSKKASEMSKEEFVKAFSSLGQEINKALTKLNIQPIDMEKLIKLPQAEAFSQLGTEFGTRFAEGFQGAVTGGSGIGESIKKQVQQLEAEQNKLLSLQKSLPKSLKRYEYLSGLSSVEKGDVRAFSLDDIKKLSPDGNADSLAQNFTDDYYNALNALEQLDAGTEQYYQTLLKVYEASSNVFRMQATIDKHPGLIKDKNILMDYGYETLQETVQNELLARDKDFYNFIEQESSLLDQIPAKLTEIEQRLNAVRQSNPEIVNQEDASAGLKTLDEIEAAYKRILNAHGKIGKQGTYIQNALDFDPTTSKQGIKALYDTYTKMPQDTPWEVQYQALLKYVKLYESYLNSSNATYRNKVTKEGNEFTKLYEQLKPMEANAENMLRNVLNMANKAPLIGMGDASDVEASQKVATESQKKAEAEAKARTESEHKAKADAEAVASAEKEKLAREASAKAAQQAAQVAEQERVAKEATAKASKDTNSSYVAGGILDNPMFSNMFGKAKNEAEEKQVANEGSAKAAQEELGATQKTTAELEKQQKLLLYRRVEGQADVSRLSGRSIDALYDKAGKPIIQGALEMGFGGFGDGLYTTTLGAAKDLLPGKGDFSFFEFDASGYNLLVNKTVEQAQALQSFLLSLQKLVGAGTLLDTSELTHIEDLSNDQLFEKAQQIFQNFSMSKQQFDAWIENAKKESEAIAKLFAKGQVPSNRHNFGTRFMQTLGYDGVLNQTGDLDIDGNYQGSVIYDPKDDMKQNARIFQNKAEFASYLKAEAQAHQENTVAINKETQAQESLNQKKTQQAQIEQSDNDGAEVAEENAKTEAIKQQNGALQENINLKTQANGQGVGGTRIGTITPTQTVPSGTISAEATELEAVRAKVLEVTNAINTKTQAFTNEEAEVKRVVTSEIASLDLLEQKVTAIKGTLEGLLSNLKTGSDNVGVGLSNITVTVNKNDNVDTKAISTYVADAPATENTLVAIKSVLDNINSKVQTGVSNRGVSSTTTSSDDNALVLYDDSTNTQRSSGGSSQIPTEQINTALTALLKYKTTLQEAHQLSGDLENGINSLYMELSQVSDRAGLSTWNEHFKQFKNASSILQTLIKDYQALGQAQARAAMETDPLRQMQHLDNAQIIQDRIDTKIVDVNVGDDRFEEARQRAYNLTTHELQQRQELADARRVETERTNAENAAIREQVQLVNQWIGLVDRMATLKTQIDSGAFDEMATARMMQQYENLRAQVDRIRPLIQTTDDVWNRVGNAYVDGRDTANTTMAANALPQLAKLYQQLGTAQANFEGKETNVTETAVKQIREKIEGQQRSLQLSQEELAILQQIASVAYRNQAEMLQSGTQDARIKEWGALTTRLESLNTQINSGEFNEAQVKAMKSEVALIERRIDELRPLIDMAEYNWNAMGSAVYKGREKGEDAILKQQVKNFKEQVKMSQKEAGLTRSGSVATKAENTLTNVMGIEGISESQIANLEQYQNKIVSLQSLIKQLRSQGSPVTDAQKQELVSQTVAVDNYTKEIQELVTNYERLSGPNSQSLNVTSTLGLGASAEDYKKELTNAVQSFHKGRASIKSFDAETNTLTYTLKTGKGEFTTYTASIRQTDDALRSVRGTTTKAMGVFESIGKKIKEYSYYFTGSMMIMRAISEVKKGISIVRDIDGALTELKKVTDETEESYDRFLDTAAKTAGKVGSTIKEIVSSTADWARLKYLGLLYGDI